MKAIWHHPNKLLMFVATDWTETSEGPPLVDPGIDFRVPEYEMRAMRERHALIRNHANDRFPPAHMTLDEFRAY